MTEAASTKTETKTKTKKEEPMTILVKNMENHVVVTAGKASGQFVKLWCGWNEVDRRDWRIARKLPAISARITDSVLLFDEAKGGLDDLEIPKAKHVVEETFNVKQLDEWKERELDCDTPRMGVVNCIEERKKYILNPKKKNK